jgi:hypothetical protein
MKVAELFETEERSVSSMMHRIEPQDAGFKCDHLAITSLNGSPQTIIGDFYCHDNLLKSLEGGPSSLDGDFYCHRNELTTLEGAPVYIGSSFLCYSNKLTSLKGIHKQIKHIGAVAEFDGNPIKSHVLGLLKIDGLQEVMLDAKAVQRIINRHLEGDRDIFACQEELIEAGFPEFAQL